MSATAKLAEQNCYQAQSSGSNLNQKAIKIAIVVGEHSGDTLGFGLMQQLKALYPNAEFIGIAGPKMQSLGFRSFFAMNELAVMGLVEVLKHLPRLLTVRKQLIAQIIAEQPDVFIGIDAPDFNLGVELKLKQQGIKTVHYVSPSVWAWREKRVFKIAKAVNLVLALLPFEKAFYDKYQVPCQFVGHTLADNIPMHSDQQQARAELSLKLAPEDKVLALMPGSRAGELAKLLPDFLRSAQQLVAKQPSIKLIAPMISAERAEQFKAIWQQIAPELAIELIVGKTQQVMAASDCLLMASGTVALEAALIKRPMVICYRFNRLTYYLGKALVKLKWFSLPNLLANKALVPELLQDQVCAEQIVPLVEQRLFTDQSSLNQAFTQIHQTLKRDADQQSALAIQQLIEHG